MGNVEQLSDEELSEFWDALQNISDNSTADGCCPLGEVCDLTHSQEFEATFIVVLYSLTFVVGVLGNGLLLGVLGQSRRTWSVTDTFILHLALADVLLLVTLPMWAAQAAQADGWTFGTPLCKITGSVFMVGDVQQDDVQQENCRRRPAASSGIEALIKDCMKHITSVFWIIRSISTVGSFCWAASVWTGTCPSSTPPRCTRAGSPGWSTPAAWSPGSSLYCSAFQT